LQENDRTQISIKDVQLVLHFYDFDNCGYLTYNNFIRMILPCDNKELRQDCCQRKTYEVDLKNGKKLHPTVENALADYLEREVGLFIKMEMMKKHLVGQPDWQMKAAFNMLDSQRTGELTHFNLFGFLCMHDYEPTDEELIAMVRRIDGN
jgi:Ca2+-binding EF-hand superfamily protein